MMNFWQNALGYVPRKKPAGDWVVLKDPTGRGPNISINLDPDAGNTVNRLHLDLYTSDQPSEVKRLLALGATVHREPEPGEDFVVLADPGGNLFCVVNVNYKVD